MTENSNDPKNISKELASVCGLYCGACSIYLATTEDPQRLKKHAAQFQTDEDSIRCHGCRSSELALFCKDCSFPDCAARHGVEFCGECPEFPCQDLQDFKDECPHRNEIYADLKSINSLGWKEWIKYAHEHYSCPECDTVNSPYDLKCRKCGHSPASDFIRDNKKDISRYLKKNKVL